MSIEEDLVVLEVSDDGAIMDPELRRKALEAGPTTVATGARGLSLLFAATQIRGAGGEILIDSAPDLGTTVRVYLSASATTGRPILVSERPS